MNMDFIVISAIVMLSLICLIMIGYISYNMYTVNQHNKQTEQQINQVFKFFEDFNEKITNKQQAIDMYNQIYFIFDQHIKINLTKQEFDSMAIESVKQLNRIGLQQLKQTVLEQTKQ